ncbi:lipase [Leptolyngbya valderiana BDU 20041]|nr:lipase [Leptolyngbya valderiana BDU 20041]
MLRLGDRVKPHFSMNSDIRIGFVGDSFVLGTGDEKSLGWVGRVCADACRQGYNVTGYNLGIRRDTSRDILQRWRDECDRRLPQNSDARVVFSFGTNDTAIEAGKPRVSASESRENTVEILTAAKQRYPTLFISPPPAIDRAQNQRIFELTRDISQLCSRLEIPYIDVHSVLLADRNYHCEVAETDGSHPRRRGYRKLAKLILTSPVWWFNCLEK